LYCRVSSLKVSNSPAGPYPAVASTVEPLQLVHLSERVDHFFDLVDQHRFQRLDVMTLGPHLLAHVVHYFALTRLWPDH
jgi:hypothetical protein